MNDRLSKYCERHYSNISYMRVTKYFFRKHMAILASIIEAHFLLSSKKIYAMYSYFVGMLKQEAEE